MSKQDKVKITALDLNLTDSKTKPLHNADGSLTAHGLLTLRTAINSPAWHHTVNLSIKGFKRYLRTIPMLTKAMFNEQVREYREKAWQDYEELIEYKGSFPTISVK